MLLTPRVWDGLLGMLEIVKNSDYINTEQINLFWREEYPFRVLDHEKVNDPLKWWMDIANHNHVNVLGVS